MNITEPSFDEAEIALLRECLNSKWVTQGPLTERFERLIAEKHGVKHALACTSCTAALHLATLALKLGPGDEVIVPAFTWVTSAHSAEYVGAKPVFVDVDLSTFNLDPDRLLAAITPRTKAIVAVHLFGLAAPMDEIKAIAEPRGIAVIEDAACAIGTTYKGKPVGAIGDIGCFSFHPRKAVTTGEGGAVTTNRDDLAERVRSQRNHGSTGAPDASIEPHGPWTMATFDNLGFNLRLSDIQAAVGVAQMGKLDRLLAERRRLGRRYSELLAGANSIVTPLGGDVEGHAYQSYVIRLLEGGRKRRNALMSALADKKIQTRPGTHAVHRLGYYVNKYALKPEQFPNAVTAEDTTITLPIFPGMTEDDQQMVVQIVRAMD
ncbi:DegT/DnrJ/EryC1/StrS family aminotransferase [Bradyrhizobium mercantei]|uniref:DegT/DnrJ/EryC1/StrS family aminotransferase n=1 Tax=Bradyrhizobium mercantei TaxID=1904807 RepID=UPI000975D075|nr:DegT/DnrJ/EryC1/StrS family aminotransferase [Bradyrhizobium mercantei]